MPGAIEFYFDFSSPYGFVASTLIDQVADRHERQIEWRPFLIGAVYKEHGGVPLEHPLKRDYAIKDFLRTGRFNGLSNMQLPANIYTIRIKEIEAGRGELRPHMLLVMDPRGEAISIPGEATVEPTFGLPAMWIEESHREEALFKGYTVVDPATVITTHITEVIREYMSELLSYAETQKLLEELGEHHQKLLADMVPNLISMGGIQRVLQNLLSERVSIRDMGSILEAISEACGHTRNITVITEHVRGRLSRQLSEANTNEQGYVPMVTLSPEWEESFAEAIVKNGEEQSLAMPPSTLQEFIGRLGEIFERLAMQGDAPALVCSPNARPFVRSIVERVRPVTVVLSQNEIHPKARIKTVGQI